ncbi:MAG: CPBP family intramembrane metalloprotease [Planctomycetes bacterium]|nr:CPBP family intramembrane metalloprotease [Planctomycetota bacterium]
MNTLIGQHLREFRESRVLVTVLCGAVLLVEFTGAWDYYETVNPCRERSADLEIAARAYAQATTRSEAAGAGSGFQRSREREEALYANWETAYIRYCQAYRAECDAFAGRDRCHLSLVVLVLLFYPIFANGNCGSIGLRLTPSEGWWYWCKAAPLLALAVAVLLVPGVALWLWLGGSVEDLARETWNDPFGNFVKAPVTEEIIYRLAVCTMVAGWFGPRSAIAVSGILFALIHLAYGWDNPVNLVAGFVLAWSFLKSNTILVPMALHSLGNILGWLLVTQCLAPLCTF